MTLTRGKQVCIYMNYFRELLTTLIRGKQVIHINTDLFTPSYCRQ